MLVPSSAQAVVTALDGHNMNVHICWFCNPSHHNSGLSRFQCGDMTTIFTISQPDLTQATATSTVWVVNPAASVSTIYWQLEEIGQMKYPFESNLASWAIVTRPSRWWRVNVPDASVTDWLFWLFLAIILILGCDVDDDVVDTLDVERVVSDVVVVPKELKYKC